MNVPADLRPRFEALLRERLGDNNALRKQVAAFSAAVHAAAKADEIDVDLDTPDAVPAPLEGLLKRLSRQPPPLHHRPVHATARPPILGPVRRRPIEPVPRTGA